MSKSKEPLKPQAGSPSQADRLTTATTVQSVVVPEDYPEAEREGQVAIVGKPDAKDAAGKRGKA